MRDFIFGATEYDEYLYEVVDHKLVEWIKVVDGEKMSFSTKGGGLVSRSVKKDRYGSHVLPERLLRGIVRKTRRGAVYLPATSPQAVISMYYEETEDAGDAEE